MSFFTSLALSARNLMTKKGRTIITSIAGSIGIISVCLVLALSNGFSNYIKKTEEDMLSYYPIEITESTMDISSVMTSVSSANSLPDMDKIGDKVYVNSFLTSIGQGLSVRNNVSSEYLQYIADMDKSYYAEIQYGYGMSLTENLFTTVKTGRPAEFDPEGKFPETTKVMSLSDLKEFYISELKTTNPRYAPLVPFAEFFGDIVNAMPGTADLSSETYGKYVQSQYSLVAGEFPKSETEAVLVVGNKNDMKDLTLAQLGYLPETQFLELFKKGNDAESEDIVIPPAEIDFNEILSKEFFLYYNDYVYQDNPQYDAEKGIALANNYPYVYNGTRASETLEGTSEQGIRIKVTGILRLKEGLTYGCLSEGLNLTEKTISNYIEHNRQSKVATWIKEHVYSIPSEKGTMQIYYAAPSENLASFYSTDFNSLKVSVDDSALRHIGGEGMPNAISIYARDFETKEQLLKYLDDWNEMPGREKADEIKYSDTVGILMSLVQTILNAVTYVLVAFTAISLVVSSVMIGIITYVSVVERVKEIGVLRSLGARKKDIRNLFNAETFIIGLSAGIFGVVVTYLLSLAVNAILLPLTGIANLASLPIGSAILMVVISVLLTLISGLIPASAAAKKDPVIALRTE